MGSENSLRSKLFSKLRDKYRLVIYNDESFEEAISFRLSRLNVFALAGSVTILFIVIVILIIIYSPLKEFIPQVPDGELQRNIVQNSMRADSLEYRMQILDYYYFENIKLIMEGKEPINIESNLDSAALASGVVFSKSQQDSVLRKEIESQEMYSLSMGETPKSQRSIPMVHYFAPLSKGIIINKFNPEESHYGIDLVAEPNEGVKAVLDGTVVLASWTLMTGYVIQIQHSNNLMSSYKHNAVLLRKEGDKIKAGEIIAIIGNSGELTTGPHLHFELWQNGLPLNPEEIIKF